ncbi:hypothetical protein SARC_01816 [Sphaeroforma arctica JP610]|uniref:Uncharacterized protein n=1 Tax=Sphaeroforma arctica JP610 TaxID=667725 RepID=A0A0L0GAK0_9EUKA|nr:hypothetical protein SARC_01816 [Sphaeroforma arctica JP610]KNC86015.1 hypothetical protein SARC_01816 [Sphaeroforma arctica JP610]|eukprot:XP_014159917.1 hypothetical protein SARC_01816 [Sphaeroforma arctica JP610]
MAVATDGTDTYIQSKTPLITSSGDNRMYRRFVLANGLPVTLVSDLDATQSSAAMGVACGSYRDPDELLGLAHLTEHMLFVGGSERYPGLNRLDKFLASHGGEQANAWTSNTATVYFYGVEPSSFNESLQLFSGFFIDPILTPESIGDEINAVNAEYEKDLPQNDRKAQMVLNTRQKQDHPSSRFTIGSTKSLVEDPKVSGTDVFTGMLKYINQCYKSRNLNLAIVSPHSLDELEAMVSELFVQVPVGDKPEPLNLPLPYDPSNLNGFFTMKPVGETRNVRMQWQLATSPYTLSSPADYLAVLVGDEADGSILATLKEDGLALSLESGTDYYEGYTIFQVSVKLTEAGLLRWPEVVSRVKEYIAMVENAGPQESVYETSQMARECAWKYQFSVDPIGYASTLVAREIENMTEAKNLLRPPSAFEYDADLDAAVTTELHTNPFLVLVMDPDTPISPAAGSEEVAADPGSSTRRNPSRRADNPADVDTDMDTDASAETPPEANSDTGATEKAVPSSGTLNGVTVEVEEWFNTPYTFTEFNQTMQDAFGNFTMGSRLHLPAKNEFQCNATDLTLLPKIVEPVLDDLKEKGDHLWHAQDVVFRTPTVVTQTTLLSPLNKQYKLIRSKRRDTANYRIGSVEVELRMRMMADILSDAAKSLVYDAERAGMAVAVTGQSGDLQIHVSGMSDGFILKFRSLLGEIIPSSSGTGLFANTVEQKVRFNELYERAAEKERTRLADNLVLGSLTQGVVVLRQLLKEDEHSDAQVQRAFDVVDADDLAKFMQEFFQDVRIEMIATGNVRHEEAAEYVDYVRVILSPLAGANKLSTSHTEMHYVPATADTTALFSSSETDAKHTDVIVETVNTNPTDDTSAIIAWMHAGPVEPRILALVRLITAMSSEQAFSVLRTTEQLGYIVSLQMVEFNDVAGISIAVQSNRHPRYLSERVGAFLRESHLRTLRDTTDAEFFEFKRSVVDELNRGDSSLFDVSVRVWSTIQSKKSLDDVDFGVSYKVVTALQKLTKEEVLEFFTELTNRCLTVQMVSQSVTDWQNDTMIATTPDAHAGAIIRTDEYFEMLDIPNRID